MTTEKKKWYKNKWVITFGGIAVLLTAIFGGDEAEQEASSVVEEQEVIEEQEVEAAPKEEPIVEEEEPQVDESAILADFQHMIDNSEGIIMNIEQDPYGSNNWRQIHVTVEGNSWEVSSETDKIEFAETVSNTIRGFIYEHNGRDRGDTILVHFYDQNGYDLAKNRIMGGYKIAR